MSAFCLKLVTTFCLCCTALSDAGNGGVVRRHVGGAVTIACRPPADGQNFLSLKKHPRNQTVLFVDDKLGTPTTSINNTGRIQLNGIFPKMDVVINNLTYQDTGLYWCEYAKLASESKSSGAVNDKGSVLLVVEGTEHTCERPKDNLILVSLLICAAVLLVLVTGFLIWIVLKTKMCGWMKPQRVPGNDVYEDMRAAMRR